MTTIDIYNTPDIITKLNKLNPDTKPLWGKMSPQNIVEHLAFSLQMSTGKNPQPVHFAAEVSDSIKQKIIYSDSEIPEGVKNPVLGNEPPPLVHTDMQTAIKHLKTELETFYNYYKENPEATHIHPLMALLNHQEWNTFHNKHFTHHFKQYNL